MNIVRSIIFYISSFLLAVTPTSQFTEGVVGQPRSFLPSQTITQTDRTISNLIYRGLFEYDIYGELKPDLAESWSVSDDGIVYTVKMKPGQYWSDGTPITADDLIYTSFKVKDLTDVATDKVDNLTVRYTLPNKYSPFLSLLTVNVMKSNTEEEQNSLAPISSGPFKVVKINRSGPIIKEVVLYDFSKKSKINRLIFRYYGSEDELITASELGEIDGFVSSKDREVGGFTEYQYPLQGVYYALFFNLRNDKFKDLETREAFAKTIPVDDLTFPYGIPVQGVISRSVYTDDELEFNSFDEDFLTDLGVENVTLTIPDLPQHSELARAIEGLWESKLGVNVEVKKVDPTKIEGNVIKDRDFEILLYGQEVGRDPDRYAYWHSTQSAYPGLNLSGFEHVRADRALEEGRNQTEGEDRVVHYNQFQEVINEQKPAIFLYHPFVRYYVSDFVEGIGDKYTFSQGDRFLDFVNWDIIETN